MIYYGYRPFDKLRDQEARRQKLEDLTASLDLSASERKRNKLEGWGKLALRQAQGPRSWKTEDRSWPFDRLRDREVGRLKRNR